MCSLASQKRKYPKLTHCHSNNETNGLSTHLKYLTRIRTEIGEQIGLCDRWSYSTWDEEKLSIDSYLIRSIIFWRGCLFLCSSQICSGCMLCIRPVVDGFGIRKWVGNQTNKCRYTLYKHIINAINSHSRSTFHSYACHIVLNVCQSFVLMVFFSILGWLLLVLFFVV